MIIKIKLKIKINQSIIIMTLLKINLEKILLIKINQISQVQIQKDTLKLMIK